MRTTAHSIIVALWFAGIVSSPASAQDAAVAPSNVRIRGTIDSVDGHTLSIKTRDGANVTLVILDNARILEAVSSSIREIKPGAFVGVTAMSQPDGSQRAVEVTIFPETMRGTGEGSRPWDFSPSSTMTNATVDSEVAGIDGQVLILKYKDAEKHVTVPANTPVVTYTVSNTNEIKPGDSIFVVAAAKQLDGTLRTQQVVFSRGSNGDGGGWPSRQDVGCQITAAGIACSAPPDIKTSGKLADYLSKNLREMPTKYNKPGTLLLGTSVPIQFVIQTTDQSVDPLFKGFPGSVTSAKVKVAEEVSAELSGPKDMIEITLRGQPRRSITNASPVSWIWDVRPLKPGEAQVTLEVFSHVKIDNQEHEQQIRVLQDTWVLKAEGLERIKYMISEIEPIQAFLFTLATALVAALGYFGFKGFSSNKSNSEQT